MPRPERRLPEPRAMVVAPQPEAVEAGAAVLACGGDALDAVLACALAQGAVDPVMCGIGGLGVLHLPGPATGDHRVLDGLATCPAACAEGMWEALFERECPDGHGSVLRGRANELGRRAVATPGVLRVLAEAHRRWGRRPWAGLFEPALALATGGWLVRPHVAAMSATDESAHGRLPHRDKLAFTGDGARLYLRPGGSPKRLGDAARNPDLARTLATLAREGAEAFCSGGTARRVAEEMGRGGGLLSAADLAGFRADEAAPLTVDYRGRTVAVPPPPAGGIMVAGMLRVPERFDLPALGHNSAGYMRVVAEAMRVAGRDKDRHVGEPRFVLPPPDRPLPDAYAEGRAAAIRAGEKARLPRTGAASKHNTTVSCMDAQGTVVSLTHTLGVPSGVIPSGTGFMLNGAMNRCDPRPGRAASVAPGKRRFSSMAPTVVLEEGRAVATLGAPGGAWIPIAILQALVNLLDFGMGMQEAVQAPRFSATSDAVDVSNRIPRAAQRGLEAMGYEVRRSPLSHPFAAVHGISMWDGRLEGGADPQRDGLASGVA